MQELLDVLQTFLATKKALSGKATVSGTADHESLLKKLPNFFESILKKQGRLAKFKVEGSIGAGNIADIPWVGVFNRSVTESAQNGYYIVLLFSKDMNSCFLSLNQGITAFEKEYSKKVAREKIKASAQMATRYFTPSKSSIVGPIDLGANGHLGKGYEAGAIESYRYVLHDLPDAATVEKNFISILEHYDKLLPVAGKSLQTLAPVSEAQYQQAALEKAANPTPIADIGFIEPSGGIPLSPLVNGVSSGRYKRNPSVAAFALEQANFKCELNPSHETFISSAKGKPYVEAHHLVPIGAQSEYIVSLDVSANIVTLCPMCHKLLHHGLPADKRAPLNALLSARTTRLTEKMILIDEDSLLKLYKYDLLEDEA